MSLCLAGAVVVTLRSGVLDQVLETAEDAKAFDELREGACIAELPRAAPDDPLRHNVRPPKVVDCDAAGADWIIDDATSGVSIELFNRYIADDRSVDPSEFCDTPTVRLWTVYGVYDSAETVTVYCIALKPLGVR
jgi:hypothetical protein